MCTKPTHVRSALCRRIKKPSSDNSTKDTAKSKPKSTTERWLSSCSRTSMEQESDLIDLDDYYDDPDLWMVP